MKKIFKTRTGKISTLITSLIVAIILWIVASYTDEREITVRLKSIPIQFEGIEVLNENGFTVINEDEIPSVNISVRGTRKNIVNAISGITANVDVSSITGAGEYSILPDIEIYDSSVRLDSQVSREVPVEIDTLEEKEIPISLHQTGVNKNHIVESVPEYSTVTVSGASSEIGKVAGGLVTVDISDFVRDSVTVSNIVLTDDSGSVLERLETVDVLGKRKISINNYVYIASSADIIADVDDDIEQEYQITVKGISPQSVTIGLKEGAEQIDAIPVHFDKSITYTPGSGEYTLNVDAPEGVYVPEASQTIKVRAEVKPKLERTISVPVSYTNVPQGLSVYADQSIDITIKGTDENINTANVTAVVDLAGCTVGNYTMPVKLEASSAVSLPEFVTISVTLS